MLADHLAHQAVDDYQAMNFEFPDENIMLVTDCETPGPDEGPEEGSRWSMYFMEFQTLWAMASVP